MKQLLKNTLPHLAYFYRYLRYRLVVILIVSILVGLLDGLGLAMFIPMLELVADQDQAATTEQMGNLAFILDGIKALGFELTLTVVLLTMLVFFTFKGLAKWLEAYLNTIYQQFFIRSIREENIRALAAYDYRAFVEADAGVIQNTLSGEAGRVVQAYRKYSQILQQLVLVMTYTALAFLSNPKFATLVVVGGLLTNVLFSVLYKKTKVLSRKLVKSNHDFQGLLIQQVAFFKYLSATASVQEIERRLIRKVYEIEDFVRKMGILNAIMVGAREPLLIGIVVITILVQVKLLGGSLATIILSLLFFYRGLTAVTSLQTAYNQFLSFSGSLSNMTDFMKDLRNNRRKEGVKTIDGFQKDIVLEDVSFSYGAITVLKNINLIMCRNETLALVGESGSGKTTLMNLMSGLLQPDQGRLLIDGVDNREVKIASLQRRIGYITQEPVIFDDTVFNNVTFWAEKNEVNLKRFWAALEKASIAGFVRELSEKEDARLGNNGINLSGGQKQRISIARELYKDVDFLFLDEATSALDSETERAIQENIDKLKGQYTILIIAHRLSTIRNADRVVVLKEGRIEHIGTYQDLVDQSVSFKRMVELQEL